MEDDISVLSTSTNRTHSFTKKNVNIKHSKATDKFIQEEGASQIIIEKVNDGKRGTYKVLSAVCIQLYGFMDSQPSIRIAVNMWWYEIVSAYKSNNATFSY